MEFTETNKIYQIIHDKKFIDWILTPTNELEEYWNNYMQQNPRDKEIIREARVLLKEIAKNRTGLKEQEIHQLWDRIDATLANRRKQNVFSRRWLAAASILIIVGLSGWLFQQYYIKEEPVIDYTAVVRAEPSSNDVTLFLSDSSHETFTSNEVDIKYDGSGVIVTGTGKVLSSEAEKNSKNEEQLNQLVVPFGKHSSITLSDGTKLWLNSGSRAIYPVTFNKKYREIFIEGEAYLEVAQNASQPFYVKTDKINVKVLGTKFNVSAYPDDAQSSVVLVEGSVEAVAGKKSFAIKPNQVFKLEKETGQTTLQNTNVLEYISWKDGWLLCNKEKLGDIAVKLSRYYNIDIEVVDEKVKQLTLSGKLDFKTQCEDVLNTIALTAPVKYEIENEVIKLRLK
jgi:ferric-dicitrate binding protein FerR (iron transport regulator)